jgi:hypothetical protein
MSTLSQPRDLRLAHRAIQSFDDAFGLELVCREGSLWVTLDGDDTDYVLEAGDTFSTRLHRRMVVYAFEPSRMSIGAAEPTVLLHPAPAPAYAPRARYA